MQCRGDVEVAEEINMQAAARWVDSTALRSSYAAPGYCMVNLRLDAGADKTLVTQEEQLTALEVTKAQVSSPGPHHPNNFSDQEEQQQSEL